MLQYIDADGRIVCRDPATPGNPIILDTDDGNLFVDAADYFSGSVSLPARSVSSSGVDGTQNVVDRTAEYYVGTPSSPSANIALGQFREGSDEFWRTAHGSHILDFDGVGATTVPQTDLVSLNHLATVRAVTPLINPLGHLVIRERTIIRPRDPGSPPTITKTLAAVTLNYRLFCGSWWGNPFQVPRADADLRFFQQFNGTDNSFSSSVDVGYPYPGRTLLVLVQTPFSAPSVTSVIVGGVAATILGNVNTANTRITLAEIADAVGTTKTITTNLSSSITGCYVHVFGVRSLTGDAPILYSAATASGSSISVPIPETENATAVVAVVKRAGDISAPTWTNADQANYFTTFLSGTNIALSVAIMPVINGSDVVASWGGAAGQIGMIAAVYT
jgi:hypothetical protein